MNTDTCDLVCLDLPRAEALRGRRLDVERAQAAAAGAHTLADPVRLMIAALLHEGDELCVCDLAWLTGRATNLVSHHLKVLRLGGLASSRRDGKLVLYTLTPRGRSLLIALLAATRDEAASDQLAEEVCV